MDAAQPLADVQLSIAAVSIAVSSTACRMSALPPWLEPLYSKLVSAIDEARLPHALLIHGPGGWGEPLLARGARAAPD